MYFIQLSARNKWLRKLNWCLCVHPTTSGLEYLYYYFKVLNCLWWLKFGRWAERQVTLMFSCWFQKSVPKDETERDQHLLAHPKDKGECLPLQQYGLYWYFHIWMDYTIGKIGGFDSIMCALQSIHFVFQQEQCNPLVYKVILP